MDLKSLQEQFVALITSQTYAAGIEGIIPGGSLSIDEATNVYRQDYRARLKEALSVNYEATWLILGDDDFFNQADLYINKYPSNLHNLTNYGEFFPEFLKDISNEASQMAMLERAFWRYFHNKDQAALVLTQAMIEEGSFDLAPLTLLESDLRIDLVWQYRESGSEVLSQLDLEETCYLALFKADEKVEIKKISKLVFDILSELKQVSKISSLTPREIAPDNWIMVFDILRYMGNR